MDPRNRTLLLLLTKLFESAGRSLGAAQLRREHSTARGKRSETVNQKYPNADPKNRLPSRGWQKWNASHQAADVASSLVTGSNTRWSQASIAGPW